MCHAHFSYGTAPPTDRGPRPTTVPRRRCGRGGTAPGPCVHGTCQAVVPSFTAARPARSQGRAKGQGTHAADPPPPCANNPLSSERHRAINRRWSSPYGKGPPPPPLRPAVLLSDSGGQRPSLIYGQAAPGLNDCGARQREAGGGQPPLF